jgi:hypothetical protein
MDELEQWARTYVWWQPPEETLQNAERLLVQLMQLGTWSDVRAARRRFGDEAFKAALQHAPPGVLDERSWNYWHHFFGLLPVPPLPERPLP